MRSKDVEALIARLREGDGNGCKHSNAIMHEAAIALASACATVSAPTGDERELLKRTISQVVGGWNEDTRAITDAVDAVLAAGFRVAPEPVYEYGQGLLIWDNPDRYELHKGPWDEPRQLDEGYHLMRRQVLPWGLVPVGVENP